jgi:hypothetical protein
VSWWPCIRLLVTIPVIAHHICWWLCPVHPGLVVLEGHAGG